MYEGKDRYQFQPWYVKAYRWLRYKPGGWYYACWLLAGWVIQGMPVAYPFKTRREVAAHIWMIGRSTSAMNMGHYWEHREIIAQLRSRKK